MKDSLVPALEGSACQCGLGNRDTLAFAPGNTAFEIIPYFSVDSMANPIHGHNDVSEVLAVSIDDAVNTIDFDGKAEDKERKKGHRGIWG